MVVISLSPVHENTKIMRFNRTVNREVIFNTELIAWLQTVICSISFYDLLFELLAQKLL